MSVQLRRALADLPDYDPRDLSDRNIRIRLHRNESALPPPGWMLDAVRAIDAETLRTYPTELQADVREELAARFGRDVDDVALASGADDMLAACARAVLEPGDNAVVATPTFGMYGRTVSLAGGTLRRVPYPRRWRIEPQDLTAATDERTRLVILGNPNNPTGDPLRVRDVEIIARARPNALILVDEVYLAFSERSLARNAVARIENVAVTGSFSKGAALAGIRLGYLIAAPQIAAAIRRSLGPYPVSAPALRAAQIYLRRSAEARAFETQLAAQNARSLDALEAALRPFARDIWRGPANFLLADCGQIVLSLEGELAERGIAVRTFGDPMLAGMIRLCATNDADTEAVVAALRAIAAGSGARA